MAPKRKELPEDDVIIHIYGLKSLRSKGMSLEGMAAYYTEVLDDEYSRRTVSRRLREIDRVRGTLPEAETKGKAARRYVRSTASKGRQDSGEKQ